MKIKFSALIAASAVLFAGPALADSLVDGDVQAGKAKSITCNACHGVDGNSSNPVWPSLAGQNAPYILAQLEAFKSNARVEPLMLGQVAMLSDEDMANLAVYFESLTPAAQAIAPVEGMSQDEVLARGESLYRGGDLDDKTSACLACHGPSGSGNPAAKYPAIAGQHATYTAKQLRDYRSGTRTTDGKTRQMRDIAETLSDEDIEALSAYIQGLH